MKIKIILIALAVIIATACGNKKTQRQSNDPAVKMLTEFYTAYITESAKAPSESNSRAMADLKNKYMTKEFRKKWHNAELEYDPFLSAQDCDTSWIRTLEINPVAKQTDVYTVCYRYNYDNKENKVCITLHLVNQNGKYQISDIEGLSGNDEETYHSDIRPNEKLQLGKIYTDNFEYSGYDDLGDYFFFIVKKDNKKISLIDECEGGTVPELNAGDMLQIEWKIDSLRPAGDKDALFFQEFAHKVTKTKDGKLSVFKKTNKKPRKYIFMEDSYTESEKIDYTNEIENFFANTTDNTTLKYLNDNTGLIQIKVSNYWRNEDEHRKGKGSPTIIVEVENYVPYTYMPVIKLGIEYDEENSDKKTYYRFDEKTDNYVKMK